KERIVCTQKEMRRNVFTVIGCIMLIGFLTIGFFIFPIGLTFCAMIGLWYGCQKNDKLFVKWSIAALIMGVILVLYTFGVIFSM
ncbi:MAG: hypothetical protein RR386_01595, partial [Bacteroidaceae bacterium]